MFLTKWFSKKKEIQLKTETTRDKIKKMKALGLSVKEIRKLLNKEK